MKDKRSSLLLWVELAFLVFILIAGVVAYQMGRQDNPTLTAAAVTSTATVAPPPRLATNTPTVTPTATLTPTATATPTSTATPSPTPTPTPIVAITDINRLGRLETTEFVMRTVIDLANEPSNIWEQIFGTDQLMLLAEGEVVAGFDLDKVEPEDFQVEGTSVAIILPAPEILYSRIDNERTQVYKRTTGLFVRPDKSLEGRARQLAEEALVAWAIERNILEKAERDGLVQLENLLLSLGFSEIELTVREKEL